MNYKCNAFTYDNGTRRNRKDAVVIDVDHLEDVYKECTGLYKEGYFYVDIWVYLNADWHFLGVFYLKPDLLYG